MTRCEKCPSVPSPRADSAQPNMRVGASGSAAELIKRAWIGFGGAAGVEEPQSPNVLRSVASRLWVQAVNAFPVSVGPVRALHARGGSARRFPPKVQPVTL